MVDLSVIIPTRCRKDKLIKTLLGFNDQTNKNFEVIVIVDGDPETIKMLSSDFFGMYNYPFKWFAYPECGGAARARNKGIDMAEGAYVLIIGDDCYPDKELVAQHLSTLTLQTGCLGFIDWYQPTEFMNWLSPAGAQFRYNWIKDPNDVGWQSFWTANISYPRTWHELERYDESIDAAGMEDIELGWRYHKRGLKVMLNKHAIVYHDHPTDLDRFSQRIEVMGYYTKAMIDKYQALGDNDAVLRMKLRFAPFLLVPGGLFLFKNAAWVLRELVWPFNKPNWFFTLCYHLAIGIENRDKKFNGEYVIDEGER